ncbi:MAG TPA: hypothetical protein VGX02_02230 [Candidatus Eremiobacteraceae bacterium]|jgi:hypothetical protein|nr:hypothetical protein [Candidatus Eremiobacteraceae bacterium]
MRWIAASSIALAIVAIGALVLWGSHYRHAALHRITSMPLPPPFRERENGLRWPLLVGNAAAPVQIPAPGDVRIEFGRDGFGRINSAAAILP